MFISIGNNCAPRLNLGNDRKSLAFDWILTGKNMNDPSTDRLTMKCVNNMLTNVIQPQDMSFNLEREELKKEDRWPYHMTHRIVDHPYFISLHDVPLESDDSGFQALCDKMNRRLDRLKDFVRSEQHITFIRIEYFDFDLDNFVEFKNIIEKLNPNLDFKVVLVSYNNFCPDHDYDWLKIFTLKDNFVENVDWTPQWCSFNWNILFN